MLDSNNENMEKNFIEDDFDLSEFKKKALILKSENFKNKYEKPIQFLSILIAILAFFIAYFSYQILDYQIGLWRNERIRDETQNILQIHNTATPPSPAAPSSMVAPVLPEIEKQYRIFSNDDAPGQRGPLHVKNLPTDPEAHPA